MEHNGVITVDGVTVTKVEVEESTALAPRDVIPLPLSRADSVRLVNKLTTMKEAERLEAQEHVGIKYQVNFTTGQVAKLFGVAPRTVSKWCDNGLLECFRIPNKNFIGTDRGKDRRIPLSGIIKFCRENKYPLPKVLEKNHASDIIVHGVSYVVIDHLKAYIIDKKLVTLKSAFDAGVYIAQSMSTQVDSAIIGDMDGFANAVYIANQIAESQKLASIVILSDCPDPIHMNLLNPRVRVVPLTGVDMKSLLLNLKGS